MAQMPNSWRQHPSMNSELLRGSSGTEQPQSQPQPQPQPPPSRARPFNNGAVQDSGSMTHQSHQLYRIQPHAQLQSQPQISPYQPTGSSSINKTRSNDDLTSILSHFLESLNQIGVHQRYVNESLSRSDKFLEALLSSVLSIRETADGLTKKFEAHDEILRKLEQRSRGDDKKVKEIDVMKVLVSEIKAFKKTLGKSCDGDDGRTVLGRLDAVTFAVGELLERARDPEANLPGPSTIIDLTESSPPPVRRRSPVQSHAYADMGTSLIPSPLPLKEKSFASGEVSTLPRSGSDSFGFLQSPMKSTPYSGRSSSAHSFANDTISSDNGATTLTQDNLELVSPMLMDVETMDPTEPATDSQASSTISMNNTDDASRTQTNSHLSDYASATATTAPRVKIIEIACLDGSVQKNDEPADSHNAGLLVTLDPVPGISTFIQSHTITSESTFTTPTSSTSPGIRPTPFPQAEVQRQVDNTITALGASTDLNAQKCTLTDQSLSLCPVGPVPGSSTFKQPYPIASDSISTPSTSTGPAIVPKSFTQTEVQLPPDTTIAALGNSAPLNPDISVTNSSVSEGKQRQKEQNQKQGLPGRLDSYLSTSTGDEEMLPLDNLNSQRLDVGVDGIGFNEEKTKAMKEDLVNDEKEEIKEVAKLDGNRKNDVLVSAPELIDLSQHLRRRSSSSRFASPSASLPNRGRTGSRPSVGPSEDVSYPSRLSSDTKLYSPTKTKVLAGANVSPGLVAAPRTASPSTASVATTRTPVTTPTRKAASIVPSHSTLRPTIANAELVAAPTIRPATSASISSSPAISPTRRNTPAVSESYHLGSASTPVPVIIDQPRSLSRTSALPVITASVPDPAISSTKDPIVSPVAIFNEPFNLSQASTTTQDEASVSSMVIEKEDEIDEGENETLVEKTTGKIEFKTVHHEFEEEEKQAAGEGENLVEESTGKIELKTASHNIEGEEKEDKHTHRPPSSSFLLPSTSGSSRLRPAKVPGPSTPRARSALSFNLLPNSPLASAAKSNRTRNNKTPEPNVTFSLSPLSSVTCTPPRTQSRSESQMTNTSMVHADFLPVQTPLGTQPESLSSSSTPSVAVVSSSCSSAAMNLDSNQSEPQSPLFSSPSTIANISVKQQDEGRGVAPNLKSPGDSSSITNPTIPNTPSKAAVSTSTHIPTQARAQVEMLLPPDLSSIPDVEKAKRTVGGTDKTRVEKLYTSLGDDADIVRAKKRKVSEGSSMAGREPSASRAANGKEKAKREEVVDLEVETKSGRPANKRSLFNIKAGKKGDSVAVTRVKKRKARPDFLVGAETDGNDDGLDEEKPLKRARQRVSDRQIKVEPAKKGKHLSREFSESSSEAGALTRVMKPRSSASVKKGPPSKGKLSANIRQGVAEIEWPTMTTGDKSEDLVGCDRCTAWYHYGCVGLTTGDKRLRGGKEFFCPPCEAGTAIKKFNMDTECWRPGCSVPTGFIVERIIGRFKKFVGGQGLQFKYLLQWKGYDLAESSWEPEGSMYDPPFMIEKFRVDALEEGIDIDKDESGLILLQVATDPSVPQPT